MKQLNELEIEFLKQDEIIYNKILKRIETEADYASTYLEYYGVNNLLELRKSDFGLYIGSIINLCKDLIWFPEKIKHNVLKEVGIAENVSRWFISCESLNNEFEELKSRNILFLKYASFKLINSHLESKLVTDFLNDNEIILPGQKNVRKNFILELKNYFRRREYRIKSNTNMNKSYFDIAMDSLYEGFEKINPDPKEIKKHFFNLLKGRNEDIFLKQILLHFHILNDHIPRRQMNKILLPLTRLLLVNKTPNDENEFIKGEVTFRNNHTTYADSTLTKLTRLNEPNFYEKRNF